jgi:modification methylase
MEGPTTHRVIHGDARDMSAIPDSSVHLVCTSPPYAFLKQYREGTPGQLGDILDYDAFLDELDKVWRECERILVPGGRVACVVGDVCISRRRGGRHHVLPLSADIQVRSRALGLDNLTPIRWYKVANIALEASTSSVFLGKPNQPNGVVKNDVEHILLLRKPGGYRRPTPEMMERSHLTTDEYLDLFSPIWKGITGQQRTKHPAPYPLEVPRRLIRMFSFAGDVVVDPFGGTGTTTLAAMEVGRSSIMYEIDDNYIELARERIEGSNLKARLSFETSAEALSGDGERIGLVRERLIEAIAKANSESDIRHALKLALQGLDSEPTSVRLTAG